MRRSVAIAALALLVLGPAAFNLARQDEYAASLELFPRAVGEFARVDDPAYYRAFLEDPQLRREMVAAAGAQASDYGGAAIERRPAHGTVAVTVEARTPERARELANALTLAISRATARQLEAEAAARIAAVTDRMRRAPSAEERSALDRRIRRLRRLPDPPPERTVVPPRPGPAEPSRWSDRAADAALGRFAARKSPFWAGVAGLVVVAALGTSVLLVRRRSGADGRP